jgi:hypothetical protein
VARQFLIANGPMPTTAAIAAVTTGTAIKTMLQVQAGSAVPFVVTGWGVSFAGADPVNAIQCELIDTYAIAATVTAHIASGVMAFGPDQTASSVALGVSATGYSASAEGTITQTRYGDVQQCGGNQYFPLAPLGREFYVPGGHNLRIRMTTATAVSATCFVLTEE